MTRGARRTETDDWETSLFDVRIGSRKWKSARSVAAVAGDEDCPGASFGWKRVKGAIRLAVTSELQVLEQLGGEWRNLRSDGRKHGLELGRRQPCLSQKTSGPARHGRVVNRHVRRHENRDVNVECANDADQLKPIDLRHQVSGENQIHALLAHE